MGNLYFAKWENLYFAKWEYLYFAKWENLYFAKWENLYFVKWENLYLAKWILNLVKKSIFKGQYLCSFLLFSINNKFLLLVNHEMLVYYNIALFHYIY